MTEPHDVPTVPELVEAVREFLEGDVMAATEGRVRFHARVAANVLAMVQRELAVGATQAAAHAERLALFGAPDDAALAAAIRKGDLDERWDEVKAMVTQSVADKLAVANPPYGNRT
ncbi:MAG: DUF6285 domain-containing protein [Acidimicrobiales bacterium]